MGVGVPVVVSVARVMMSRSTLACVAITVACASACNSKAPPRGPEQTCATSCEARDKNCSEEECWRGCNLVLDRLAEHEGDRVVACVAETPTGASGALGAGTGGTRAKNCGDRIWARCAARAGPHADGGPPAPPPAADVDDFDQE